MTPSPHIEAYRIFNQGLEARLKSWLNTVLEEFRTEGLI